MDFLEFLVRTFTVSVLIGSVSSDFCNSYCDEEEQLQNGFECLNPAEPYCCGGELTRFCCSDNSTGASSFPALEICDPVEINWSNSRYSVRSISLITTAIAFAIAIVCCMICGIKQKCRQRRIQREREERRNARRIVYPGDPDLFTLDQQFPFGPPDYDTIAKDLPPPYSEIIGNDNPAVVLSSADLSDRSTDIQIANTDSQPDTQPRSVGISRIIIVEEGLNAPPPPPYTIEDASTTQNQNPQEGNPDYPNNGSISNITRNEEDFHQNNDESAEQSENNCQSDAGAEP